MNFQIEMNRRVDREFRSIWRQVTPRYVKMLITVVAGFILFNLFVYMSLKYFIYPEEITTTTEATTEPPTTTTTTTEATTEKPFSTLRISLKSPNLDEYV